MKQISINECHDILLNIAKEFHRICTENNIPYYMLGGTMLGAIRHKGFIPWDDDMDFGIPRKDYERALSVLKKEIKAPYQIRTKDEADHYYAWYKIEDKTTHIDDPCFKIPIEKKIGVNIDIFPLDSLDDNDFKLFSKIEKWLKWQQTIFVENKQRVKWKAIIKSILRAVIPFGKNHYLDKCEALTQTFRGDKYWGVVYGLGGERDVKVPKEWYGTKKYPFESIELFGLTEADKYLTFRYGDYMKIPPKSQWHYHADNIYKEE